MKSDFADKIRVDQSHCNHHLIKWLILNGHNLLFSDAGRVTRGGTGSQGNMLRLFESNSLHIPDIISTVGDCLYIIEVDYAFSKASNSLTQYRSNAQLILTYVNAMLDVTSITKLVLYFCYTGVKNESSYEGLLATCSGKSDGIITFDAPKSPVLLVY